MWEIVSSSGFFKQSIQTQAGEAPPPPPMIPGRSNSRSNIYLSQVKATGPNVHKQNNQLLLDPKAYIKRLMYES